MKKMGRPPYEPTDADRAKVKIMVAAGMPAAKIAAVLEIGKTTLYEHYKKEIQTAAAELNAQVVANLFQMTKKNPAAAIFWTKTRLGWRETDPNEAPQERLSLSIKVTPHPDKE